MNFSELHAQITAPEAIYRHLDWRQQQEVVSVWPAAARAIMQHADVLCIATGSAPTGANLRAVADVPTWVAHRHGLLIAVASTRLGGSTDRRCVCVHARQRPSRLHHERQARPPTWS